VGGLAEAAAGFRHMTGAELTAFVPHRPARPEKSEGGIRFKLESSYEPAGDQPQAIEELVAGLTGDGSDAEPERDQVLLGVTGSGKTFTMAKVIERLQRPALVLAPNKTLAAQLYSEMKGFFPENAVEYFVSYYDYYQPEAYIPRTDTYIEKDSSVNEQIDRMRHAATRAILERDDVIIVASVSCIYGIGAVETYSGMAFSILRGEPIRRADLLAHVLDASVPEAQAEIMQRSVEQTLEEIGAGERPRLLVLNKVDLLGEDERDELRLRHPDAVQVSGVTGEGLQELSARIERELLHTLRTVELLVPYADGGSLAELHEVAGEVSRQNTPEGVRVHALVPARIAQRFARFAVAS